MYEALYTVIGVIIGFIMHWGYILWQKRDLIQWGLKYWVDAWSDRKITAEEVIQFIEQLVEKLGLKDKVVIQKKT